MKTKKLIITMLVVTLAITVSACSEKPDIPIESPELTQVPPPEPTPESVTVFMDEEQTRTAVMSVAEGGAAREEDEPQMIVDPTYVSMPTPSYPSITKPTTTPTLAQTTIPTTTSQPTPTSKPTPATEPTATAKPTVTSKPTPTSTPTSVPIPTEKPTVVPARENQPQYGGYEWFNNLSSEDKDAWKNSFGSMDAFYNWLINTQAEYSNQPSDAIEISPGQSINLSELAQ